MIKGKTLIVLILFTQFNLFFTNRDAFCQQYKFMEINRYGDKSENDINNILINPFLVISDEKNYVYIMDRAILGIKIFNSNGEGLKTIGNKGQGPHEFLDITTMICNLKNELVVVDRGNAKFVVFNTAGQFVKTYKLPLTKTPYPAGICCTSDSGYILLSNSSADDFILHKFTKNFEFVKSFGKVPIIDHENKNLEKFFTKYTPGAITIDSRDNIYYTPGLYDGKIYIYNKMGNLKVIKSKLNYKLKSYIYEKCKLSGKPKIPYEQTVSNQFGRFAIHRNLISGGINIMSDGKIAHLVISYKDFISRKFGIEIFSTDGLKSNYYKIDNKNLLTAVWTASRGKWYFIDFSGDFPIVREYELVKELK